MQLIPPTSFMPLPATQGLTQPGQAEKEAKLKEQVDEFAGLLFSQLVREMRESGMNDEGEGIFGGGDTNHFMHLFDQAVGKAMITQGGSSLRDTLYKQLSTSLHAQQNAKGDPQ